MSLDQGMDPGRVRQIASGLDSEIIRLGEIVAAGTTSADVLVSNWDGPDGQELIVRWRSQAAKQIGAATELLRETARELRRQADQQDAASNGTGPGGGGGGGHGGSSGGGGGGGRSGGRGQGQDGPANDGRWPDGPPDGYDILGRDPDSVGVRTNRGDDNTQHHYDPLTGKTWQEAEDGSWRNGQDVFGNETVSRTDTTDHGNGWESSHESTRGQAGRGEWGDSWSTERSFDNEVASNTQAILDNVQSEPIVEQELWDVSGHDAVAEAHAGDDRTGASAEFLSYDASTDGSMGIDATRGAYIEANAEAGAYLGRAEAHWTGDHGTTAQAEAMVGAEGQANAGAQLGPAGAQVAAGFEAFAGGRVEGGFSQDLGPADVGASGSLSYGIGAHADASAEVSMDRVGVSFDIGATLGVGASLSLDVSVSPNEIVDGLADVGEALEDSPINPGNWW